MCTRSPIERSNCYWRFWEEPIAQIPQKYRSPSAYLTSSLVDNMVGFQGSASLFAYTVQLCCQWVLRQQLVKFKSFQVSNIVGTLQIEPLWTSWSEPLRLLVILSQNDCSRVWHSCQAKEIVNRGSGQPSKNIRETNGTFKELFPIETYCNRIQVAFHYCKLNKYGGNIVRNSRSSKQMSYFKPLKLSYICIERLSSRFHQPTLIIQIYGLHPIPCKKPT